MARRIQPSQSRSYFQAHDAESGSCQAGKGRQDGQSNAAVQRLDTEKLVHCRAARNDTSSQAAFEKRGDVAMT